MLNSSSTTFNNNFPTLYEDNNIALFSQLSEDTNNPFGYYDNLQSPMFYYDVENYVEYLSNHDLIMVQQQDQEPLQATNSSPITTTTDDSSIMENNNMELLSNDNNNNNSNNNNNNNENNNGGVVLNKPSMTRGSSKRRTSKKDRHSKIRTAHGLRDRRMRLSLEVARSFFKLQDMLGFDKGSRTVEWLMKNSKEAIDELVQSKNGSVSGLTKCTMSSTSDNCEGDSIVVEQKMANNTTNNIKNSINNTNNKGKNDVGCVTKDANNNNYNYNYNNNNRKIIKEKRLRTTKEAMKRARDKARKRTLEKMLSKGFMDGGNWSLSTNFSTYQNGDICQSVRNTDRSVQESATRTTNPKTQAKTMGCS